MLIRYFVSTVCEFTNCPLKQTNKKTHTQWKTQLRRSASGLAASPRLVHLLTCWTDASVCRMWVLFFGQKRLLKRGSQSAAGNATSATTSMLLSTAAFTPLQVNVRRQHVTRDQSSSYDCLYRNFTSFFLGYNKPQTQMALNGMLNANLHLHKVHLMLML